MTRGAATLAAGRAGSFAAGAAGRAPNLFAATAQAARRAASLAAVLGPASLAAACGEPDRPPAAAAPALPRAAVVLEPPRIRVGEVATLEVVVATPPASSPRPLALPAPPAGLWILGVEALPVERQASRWLHRTRVRVRAREVGKVTWPGSLVEVESPDGAVQSLPLDPLPIEVASILPEFPDRVIPFGVREPPEPAAGGKAALWGAAAGAGLVLAGLAAARVHARRRARPAAALAVAAAPPREPPWTEARAALARARSLADRDPFAASDQVARALRRYASRRFDTPAATSTTEELGAAPAPFAAWTRWPLLLAALRSLDEHRFRPRSDPEARAAVASQLPDALALASRFVEETLPPGTPS
jgi:hypothetical protein